MVIGCLKLTEDLPVIDGAAALYPIFSGFVNAVYPADSVHFDGENFTPDSALQYTNTRGAYKGIVDGTVDIAICVAPSEEQLAYAAEQGVELEFTPIGREAFVFFVNQDNPVDGLTTDQLRGIYAGQYRSWSEVGGDNTHIAVLQRNAGSGSQSALLNFMGDTPVKTDYLTFMGRSIGFSFRFYVEGMVGKDSPEGGVKLLALDGVYPRKSPRKQCCEGTSIFLPFYVQPLTGCFHFYSSPDLFLPLLFACLVKYSRAIITGVSGLLYYTILQVLRNYNRSMLIYVKTLRFLARPKKDENI